MIALSRPPVLTTERPTHRAPAAPDWPVFAAFEAALAARDWVCGHGPLAMLVSYVDPRNLRSIRLAERLGAVRDAAAPVIEGGDVVMRHRRPGTGSGART